MAKKPTTMKAALKKWEGSPKDKKLDKVKGWAEGSKANNKSDREHAKKLEAKKGKK